MYTELTGYTREELSDVDEGSSIWDQESSLGFMSLYFVLGQTGLNSNPGMDLQEKVCLDRIGAANCSVSV